jgi:integrase
MAWIEKRGKGYRVKYGVYENGVRIQRSKSFSTAKEAKEFASKVEYELDTGQYSYSKGRTLADVLNEWLDVYCVHLRPNALADMKTAVRVHIIPYIGNVPLENVTTGMIQKLYNNMMKREWKPAVYKEVNGMKVEVSPAKTYSAKTVRNVHSALKQALDQAVRTNLISRNPCSYVQLPKKESIDYVIPTPEQLESLLKALSEQSTYYPILICAVLGCRRGEALGLQWQDIDFQKNTVHIRRAYIYNSLNQCNEIGELKTKNSKRVLPLPEMLKAELLKLKEHNKQICEYLGIEIPYLCINDAGQMLTPNLCSHHFQQAAKKVGLKGMRLHDLRHTVVTYMLDAGENPKTVQEFVGHADPGFMLRQYAHVLEQSKKRASDTLMRTLFGQNM